MKAGGGILGIIVVLAAILLPKLLGGGGQSFTGADDAGAHRRWPTPASSSARRSRSRSSAAPSTTCRSTGSPSTPSGGARPYRDTDTAVFTGGTDTGCGQASSQMGPFYCPADETVYFDLDFLAQLQQQFGAPGDLAAQYIVAHEYGHHVQNVLGVSSEVSRLQQQNPGQANQYSVALELQADCLAGAWARSADERGLLEQGEISEALTAAAAVGDDRIQEQAGMTVDPDSFTHGTSEQRVQWFRRGYDTGDPTRCTTFDEL